MRDATLVNWLVRKREPVTLELLDEFYVERGLKRPRNASFEALRRLTQRRLIVDGAVTEAAGEAAQDALAEATCGKRRYSSQETAERALADVVLKPGLRRRECRAYSCDRCGGWHLTSRTRIDYGTSNERRTKA